MVIWSGGPAGDDTAAGPDLGQPALVGIWRTGCYMHGTPERRIRAFDNALR